MFGGDMHSNVAIIGGSGQLGRQLVKLYPGCFAPTSTELDLCYVEKATKRLEEFDLVINCAAIHDMKECEEKPHGAFLVNAMAPYMLAMTCKKLIHISTAYVFGNDPVWPSGRRESDAPSPLSVYGTTKYLGELMIRLAGEQHLIVRTDALYGPGGPSGKPMSFVEGVRTRKYTQVKRDEFCNPTSCIDLARAIKRHEDKPGIIHLVNQPTESWYDFARMINPDVEPVPASQFDDGVKRPKDSGMCSTRFDTGMMSVEDALAEYLELTTG
jgi:dTDP-4-dehydrorhamnose reductase